jgi:hypothetical protein
MFEKMVGGHAMMGKVLAGVALAVGLAGSAAAQAPAKADYSKSETWLCWPGKAGDACDIDMTATVVAADGSSKVEAFKADPKAPIDCFYVYPTVSTDPGVVSDLTADPAERSVVKQQLARFGSKCRIYAPLYRQITLSALRSMMSGAPPAGLAQAAGTGYGDVVDAWNYYLAHENKGRGVVLIGHSQGSGVLTRFIPAEIEGKPVQKQLISALILGTNLPVEAGKDTGAFKTIPLCKSATQTGCAISYVTFRADVPPPADSIFGKVREPGMVAACTNPAALAGGKGELKAYMSNQANIATGGNPPPEWVKGKANPSTPFVALPGFVSGECVSKDGFTYLAASLNADPADPRTDVINGDVMAGGQVVKSWGLHLIDVNIAIGNLVDIVGQQSKAYLAKK